MSLYMVLCWKFCMHYSCQYVWVLWVSVVMVVFFFHLIYIFYLLYCCTSDWYCWCIVMDSWILFVSVDMEWWKKFRHFSSDRVWHWSKTSWATQSNQNWIPVALWQSHQNHCAFTLLAVVTYSRYGVLTVLKTDCCENHYFCRMRCNCTVVTYWYL
jgi:hypothetical protein